MKTAHGRTGVTMNLTPDAKHGVATQDPESTLATMGGIGDVLGDFAVGVPTKVVVRMGSASFVAAATDYTADVFAKDCPHKMRLLDVSFQVQALTLTDWTDADNGNLDLKVEHGDGAASESFNEVMADFAIDDDYAAGEGARVAPLVSAPLVIAYQIIDEGESLRVVLTADPDDTITTGAAATWIDVILTLVRVN